MRKRNEGYSLVLVLVVLVVICLVATFILSFSLSNLKNQQASVERMQDRYAAAGEIEKIVAELEDRAASFEGAQTITLDDEVFSQNNPKVSFADKSITISATCGTIRVECGLSFDAESVEFDGTNTYTLQNCIGVEYVSYQISTVEEVAE